MALSNAIWRRLAAGALGMMWMPVGVCGDPATEGAWTGVLDWPIEAIHSVILPTGKVMVWQTWTDSIAIWDPATGQFTDAANPAVNIFCAGHAWLPDGRLLVVGGHVATSVGLSAADIYDPWTNTWAGNVPDMNDARWYPSATTLGTGDVLVMSGDILPTGVNQLPQVYEVATNSWRDLTSAYKVLPLYPRSFLLPDGNVAMLSGVGDETEVLDTSGTGQWSYLEDTLDEDLNNYGPAVMYDAGKVAYFGGGADPTANISIIDFNETNPFWRYGSQAMAQPRRQNDATILADGTVLISGGSTLAEWNNPAGHVPVAEIWDPDTEQVTQVAAASEVYRGYHSTANLLPDGRVLITGGDHDHGGHTSNLNAEIYSPAYLFRGPRPTITSAPSSAVLGTTLFVETPDASDITEVNFIVPGATTHSQNWTQRINRLEFEQVAGGLHVTLPENPNVAPPGYYMLFLINQNGVPSLAEWVRAELFVAQLGDYNGDRAVDAADYTLWRDTLGESVALGTGADGDGSGVIDQGDYDVWMSHFGQTAAGLRATATATVPEPAAIAMAMVFLSTLLAARRRRCDASGTASQSICPNSFAARRSAIRIRRDL